MAETPFHSYPQKFPKARSKARELVTSFHELTKKGPRTLIATVVDTSFHVTQGYCTCTTELGVIRVFAIPYGQVVPQMRVYVRQMGPHGTTRDYIFDGFAQNASRLGQSGSLIYDVPLLTNTTTPLASSAPGQVLGYPGITSSTGFYWHCFFYMPTLPQGGSTATLFQMVCASTPSSPSLVLEMLPTGILRVRSSDGYGYQTNTPISPHNIHWVVIQPNLGTTEFLVDGVSNYSLLNGTDPTFAGGTSTYTLSLLGNSDGTSMPPLGSWISKFGYGIAYQGGQGVALPVATPTSDATVVNAASGGIVTNMLLLCEDGVQSQTLLNSGINSSGDTLAVQAVNATVQVLGPY